MRNQDPFGRPVEPEVNNKYSGSSGAEVGKPKVVAALVAGGRGMVQIYMIATSEMAGQPTFRDDRVERGISSDCFLSRCR